MTTLAQLYDNPLTLTLDGGPSLDARRFALTEAMSQLFEVEVVAFSRQADHDLDQHLGAPAQLTVQASGEQARTIAGICHRFDLARANPTGYSTYRVGIVPRLWLTTQRRNYRVFERMSNVAIVQRLLEEWRIPFEARLDVASHRPRELRVQREESDFAFVSRLLEEAGVSYFFDSTGELVLSDAPERTTDRWTLPFVGEPEGHQRRRHVTDLAIHRRIRPGRYSLRDRDHRLPAAYALGASTPERDDLEGTLEQFDYVPGCALFDGPGSDTPVADDRGSMRSDEKAASALADQRLDAVRSDARRIRFRTNEPRLAAGQVLAITDHPHGDLPDGECLLIVATELTGSSDGERDHVVQAVLATSAHRPPIVTPKPRALGIDSATVVGPPGEEIHCDEMGRVRVHFHWDRYSEMDERSCCWIPVSQAWAGPGYGMMNLPRVGHEVTVAFLGGDPDKPVVVGRLHTAESPVPYALPAHKAHSGWRSCSTPGGEGFNEIRMQDEAGQELLYVQAQRDREQLVKNDEREVVGQDRDRRVGRDETITVEQDQTLAVMRDRATAVTRDDRRRIGRDRRAEIAQDETVVVGRDRDASVGQDEHWLVGRNRQITVGASHQETVGAHRSRTVANNETVMVGGNQSLDVASARNVNVGGSQSTQIGRSESIDVGKSRSLSVGKSATEKVGMAKMVNVGLAYALNVGGAMNVMVGAMAREQVGGAKTIVAGTKIELVCGKSKLVLAEDGSITLEGVSLVIQGEEVQLRGEPIRLN